MSDGTYYLLIASDQDGTGVKQWLYRKHPIVSNEIDSLEPLAHVDEIVAAWELATDG